MRTAVATDPPPDRAELLERLRGDLWAVLLERMRPGKP